MAGASNKSLIPSDPKAFLSQADDVIERLNKLIRTTAGLGSLLSTLSYSLYIAAYLDVNGPSRAQIISSIGNLIGRTSLPPQVQSSLKPKAVPAGPIAPSVSRFAPLIGLLNDTRFALRLTGLIPLYVLLKNILKNRASVPDPVLRNLAILQATCYIVFQIFENIWVLTARGVLSAKTAAKFGGPGNILLLSCRPWLLAITCDFLRLAREAQLASQQSVSAGVIGEKDVGSTADKKLAAEAAEKKWWNDLFVASSWYPMAWHYSLDGGIGLNQGLVGLCGMLAGSGGLRKAWAATKE